MFHGPSLAIGGVITGVTIAAIFVLAPFFSTPELEIITPQENIQSNDLLSLLDNASPVFGDKDAPLLLLEFGDYQCFFCNKFYHETEQQLVEKYVNTGKVKLVFKDFTIIGQDSVSAAFATYCAQDQNKYWEYHDILYENWSGENNGWASPENLFEFATQLKLNPQEFIECMSSEKHHDRLLGNNADAKRLGISGTPAFILIDKNNNSKFIGGFRSFDDFSNIIDSELSKIT